MEAQSNLAELLQWYAEVGADEAIGDLPVDRTRLPPEKAVILPLMAGTAAPVTVPVAGAIESMKELLALTESAKTIEELKTVLESFQGLSLRRTATQIVFADGVPTAKVMVIGDAPGADEDRAGRPFAGVNGQLLDKMLAAIGLSREENVYITTIINWRTPGNRAPTQTETDLSLPFIRRHIGLVNPAVLVYVGGAAAKMLQQTSEPISRLRGKWLEYKAGESAIPSLVLFHPEYLLQNPAQKRVAWEDLKMLQVKLKELGVI